MRSSVRSQGGADPDRPGDPDRPVAVCDPGRGWQRAGGGTADPGARRLPLDLRRGAGQLPHRGGFSHRPWRGARRLADRQRGGLAGGGGGHAQAGGPRWDPHPRERQERIEQALKRLPQLAEIKTKQSKKTETARAPAFLGRRRYRLGGCDRRRLGGGLLPRLDRGRVPGDVPNDRGPQRGADQRLMDPGSRTGGCGAYTSIAGFCPESRPTTCWKDEFRLGWFRRVRRPPPTGAILLRSSNPAQV